MSIKHLDINKTEVYCRRQKKFLVFSGKISKNYNSSVHLFIWSFNFSHMCEKLTKSVKFSHLLLIFHNKFCKRCEKFTKGVKISHFFTTNFAKGVKISHFLLIFSPMCEKFKLQMNRASIIGNRLIFHQNLPKSAKICQKMLRFVFFSPYGWFPKCLMGGCFFWLMGAFCPWIFLEIFLH